MKVTCSNSEKFPTNEQKNQSCLSVNSYSYSALTCGSVKWFENAFTWAYVILWGHVNLWFKKPWVSSFMFAKIMVMSFSLVSLPIAFLVFFLFK